MKTIIEYDNNDMDDIFDLEIHNNARELYLFRTEVYAKLRDYLKYSELKPNQGEILEELREYLREMDEVHLSDD